VPVISFESDIRDAIQRYYGETGSSEDEMLREISDEDEAQILELMDAGNEANNVTVEEEMEDEAAAAEGPVIQLVNGLIAEAMKIRASDIHIEPYEKVLRVRYRVDGVLQEMKSPPKKFQNAIVSRIKIMSDLDIAEKRLPQDGRFKLTLGGKSVDFRVSVCPMSFGEKVVIRILDSSNLMLDMTALGLYQEQLDIFNRNIKAPWGMCLVTGPTGSGKSTTLYSALSTINDAGKNISTIEDPVEYQLKGINQVQARPDIGLDFSAGLKSFLRQDPDIIMVGEIRDLETGAIAVKAALTGHLVLSTLHTNDAPSTVNRLQNMGIEPFLITASLNMVVAQRLVRRICEACKEDWEAPHDLIEGLNIPDGTQLKKGHGCDRCLGRGYKGRVALYEVMELSDKMREAIVEGTTTTQLKRMAMENNLITLRMSGVRKIVDGVTTPDEVLGATAADER
jgi:type IV pilus assembly protein PilB